MKMDVVQKNYEKKINYEKISSLKSIFSLIQKFTTIDDGGHLSAILFTRGCNFRCDYCHNPQLVLNPLKEPLLKSEIQSFLEKRKNILDSICITGGEPTLWGEDLFHWCVYIKSLGYRIKLDTNGTNPNILNKLIKHKLVDKVAIDIKTNFSNYEKITKQKTNISKIKESIKIIIDSKIESDFRSTIHSTLHKIEDIILMIEELKDFNVTKFALQFFVNRDKLVGDINEDKLKSQKKFFETLLKKNFKNYELRNID